MAEMGEPDACQRVTSLYRCATGNLEADGDWSKVPASVAWPSYEDLEASGGTEPLKLPAYIAAI